MISSFLVLLSTSCNKPNEPGEHASQPSEASPNVAPDKHKTLNQILETQPGAVKEKMASDSGADCSKATEQYKKFITSDKPNHYTIKKELLERHTDDPSQSIRSARIVPSLENGKSNGFRVFAIRPCSLYTALGFINADTIHSVNDEALTSPDAALAIHQKMKNENEFKVQLTRDNKPVTLFYQVKE